MKWSWSLTPRRREEKKLAERRRRVSDRPEALPVIRERTLTLPFPPNNTGVPRNRRHQRTCDQQQSKFFAKLPQEIRYLIYREVLAPTDHSELHVASADQRLLSRRCVNENLETPGLKHSCWGRCYKLDGTTARNPSLGRYEPEDDSPYPVRLGLLRSCRQAYSESIDILYSQNIISFRQTRTIVDLQRTIVPQRFHSIRSMHLYFLLQLYWYESRLREGDSRYPFDIPFFWESAWKTIAEMKSLQSLRVEFTDGRAGENYPEQDAVVHLLKPMVALKFSKYLVQFDWPVQVDELVRSLGNDVSFEIQIREKPAGGDYYW